MPTDLSNSIVLGSKSRTAFLQAYHVPTRSVLFLDVSQGEQNVSDPNTIKSFKTYLDKLAVADMDINWDTLKQGHVLALSATEVVEDAKDADIIYTEHTTSEEVEKFL